MHPQFLEYYNRELTYMREMSGEFAAQHPKIARRLGLQGNESADPFVERLIESFCFISARTQLKLDAEFPRFTQRLLEVIYPNYIAPTPSMAVARLLPDHADGDFSRGFTVPRHSSMKSGIAANSKVACEFRSSQAVTLWPIEISAAHLSAAPPDLPDLSRSLPPGAVVRGALRLRLQVVGALRFDQIEGLDRLPVYLGGDERIASHLFELIHAGALATVIRAGDGEATHVIAQHAVVHEGLGPDEGLLPLPWRQFHGHNLLHEYFACPARFYFFTLTQLAPALRQLASNAVEIMILLDRLPRDLIAEVNATRFLLFCTPVINLFPKRSNRVEVDRALTDFHLLPDRTRPLDYEVFSVDHIEGQQAGQTASLAFTPLYQTVNSDRGNHGRYFSVRREQRVVSADAKKHGLRTGYAGTEVFVSLVDQTEAPYPDTLRYLSVDALVTNRDLPRLIPRNGKTDLTMADAVPLQGIALVRLPTAPRAPYAQGEAAWRLIRQLSFNYMAPGEPADTAAAHQSLRDMLRLFVEADEHAQHAQIDGLISSQTQPVMRRLPGSGLLVYGRGIHCDLMLDETAFSGASPYLFGLVLEHYLARHVSINVFTETALHTLQRGQIKVWPVRMGQRNPI